MELLQKLYNKLVLEQCFKNYEENKISEYIKKIYYEMTIIKNLENPDWSKENTLEKVAASFRNPNTQNIGQKAQLEYLKTIPGLSVIDISSQGINLIENYGLDIAKTKKSNLIGVKSFDFYEENNNALILAKTVDLSEFSKTTGGGAQDNVEAEIAVNFEHLQDFDSELYYNKKQIQIWILVDGRSSSKIINKYSNKINHIITKICSSDDLMKEFSSK